MNKILVRTFKEFVMRRAVVNSEEELIKILKKFRYPKYINFRGTNWIVEKNLYLDAKCFELKDIDVDANSKRIKHISIHLGKYNFEIKYGYEVYEEEYNVYEFVPSRQDGPAIRGNYYNGVPSMGIVHYAYWYRDGKLNRTNGPAVLVYNCFDEVEKEGWYIKGNKMNELQIEIAKKLYGEVN